MEIRNSLVLLNNLLLPQEYGAQTPAPALQKQQQQVSRSRQPIRDVITLSGQKQQLVGSSTDAPLQGKQSRLVSETLEEKPNGFRRIQEFENSEGRKFTRVEDLTTSGNRSRRVVIQQNDSGSTTILENIFDRQEDGAFRLTSRYTNEAGETTTDIKFNVTPESENIIMGKRPSPDNKNENPFRPSRGTQLDLSA
jgi:hypothetical protein